MIPLRGRLVLEIEACLVELLQLLDRLPEPDDFVLYPEKRTGGGRLLAAYPKRRMSCPTVHRWSYRHADAAGLVGAGMTSGLNMHRARHTFATELRRVADLGAASQALGHSDPLTTALIYGHCDLSDVEARKWRRRRARGGKTKRRPTEIRFIRRALGTAWFSRRWAEPNIAQTSSGWPPSRSRFPRPGTS